MKTRFSLTLSAVVLLAGMAGCFSSPVGLLDLADAGFDSGAELVAVDAKVSARSDGEGDPCPTRVDPNDPPNRLACHILARLDYLNHGDCDLYTAAADACDLIQN